MTASLRVPAYLQWSTDAGGPARVAWLAALPDRVAELCARWGLELGAPFEPGGNCSWVAPGTDGDGREVVLKVAWRHSESTHEAEGLAALGGHGAVEVYAFEHLADDPSRLDAGLACEGFALFRELSRPAPTDVLLFTDLHAGNVLSSERSGWLLIDPKPYVGDRHYDVTQHLFNCDASLQADPIALLTTVAELAGLDAERVRQWLFARCAQGLLVDGEPPWAGLDVVLRKLAT